MTTKISVTRALATLSKIEDKITKRINTLDTIHIARGEGDRKAIPGSLVSVSAFESTAVSDFQGLVDLMKVRDELKAAVVQSNAVTKVTVGGVEMTVAQAIERKRTIIFNEQLLAKLIAQYNHGKILLKKENSDFEMKLEQARAPYISRDKAPDPCLLYTSPSPRD